MVWERYTGYSGGQYKYDTYLAKNTGSGWGPATTIPRLSQLAFGTPTDPLPVVSYKTVSSTNRILVCAKGQKEGYNALLYQYSDDQGNSWYPEPDVDYRIPSTSSAHQNPSLSMGPTAPASTVYLTYDDGAQVYMNSYTTAWGSPENVSSASGCTGNKYSSVEVDGASGRNVAWEAKKSSNNKYVIVHRRKTSSWEPYVYFEPASTSTRYHRPSVTGLSQNRRAIVWHDEGGAVYRAYTANGLSWSVEACTDTWLQHPNLSAGSTDSARFVFTGGSASPYRIYLSGSIPPPGGQGKTLFASGEAEDGVHVVACPLRHHRAAVLSDAEGVLLAWLQYGELEARSRKGERIPLELVSLAGVQGEKTVPEVFTYLATQPVVLPQEVDSLVWVQELYAKGLERLADQAGGTPAVRVELLDPLSGRTVALLHTSILAGEASAPWQQARVGVDISAYAGKEVVVAVRPVGLSEGMEKVCAALGEVFMVTSPFGREVLPKPEGQVADQDAGARLFCLEQSYPNPCNPCAEVRYRVPERCQVTLAVYNLMGQEVKRLVEEVQEAGVHVARWDGTDSAGREVASGVYLYRLAAGGQVKSRKLLLVR
ncbi:MAG: T9SS type A sorting domain-containing protein [Calditrichaeota bacterium]|nr:T9SS type A sorting domain-containing protein [Calditrichota bacterium]